VLAHGGADDPLWAAWGPLNSVISRSGAAKFRAVIGPNGAGKSTFFIASPACCVRPRAASCSTARTITGLRPTGYRRRASRGSYQITISCRTRRFWKTFRIAAQSRRHGWNMFRHYSAFRDIIDKADAVLESVVK